MTIPARLDGDVGQSRPLDWPNFWGGANLALLKSVLDVEKGESAEELARRDVVDPEFPSDRLRAPGFPGLIFGPGERREFRLPHSEPMKEPTDAAHRRNNRDDLECEGEAHIAPLGLIEEGAHWVIAPFGPSKTLENLRENPFAAASHTDDVRVVRRLRHGTESCGRLFRCARSKGGRLADCVSHWELKGRERRRRSRRPRFAAP